MGQEMLSVVKPLWEQALGTEARAEDNFFDLGGTSLLATQLIFLLSAHIGVHSGPIYDALYGTKSLAEFSAELSKRKNGAQTSGQASPGSMPLADRRDPIRLSFAQEGLWLTEQIHPETAVYHIPCVVRIKIPLDQ